MPLRGSAEPRAARSPARPDARGRRAKILMLDDERIIGFDTCTMTQGLDPLSPNQPAPAPLGV